MNQATAVCIGRLGYASKGIVYTLVGLLSARALLGVENAAVDFERVFHLLLRVPLGQVLLSALALGLSAYGLWRLTRTILGVADGDLAIREFFARASSVVIDLGYFGLSASGLLLGSADDGVRVGLAWADWLLSQPLGRWALGLACVTIIGYELYRAYTASFRRHLELDELGNGYRGG